MVQKHWSYCFFFHNSLNISVVYQCNFWGRAAIVGTILAMCNRAKWGIGYWEFKLRWLCIYTTKQKSNPSCLWPQNPVKKNLDFIQFHSLSAFMIYWFHNASTCKSCSLNQTEHTLYSPSACRHKGENSEHNQSLDMSLWIRELTYKLVNMLVAKGITHPIQGCSSFQNPPFLYANTSYSFE